MSADEFVLGDTLVGTPFTKAHPNLPLDTLPNWLRENIDEAKVYGNGNKGVVLPDGRKYHLDNRLNDLTGRDWTLFINSVFRACSHYGIETKTKAS